MDADRFDQFARNLGTGLDRRGVLASVLGGLAGFLGPHGTPEAEAHDTLRKCKKLKDKKKRQQCVKQAKRHSRQHRKKKKPKEQMPEVAVQPADDATRDAMIAAATQSSAHGQLVDHLRQEEQATESGAPDIWDVVVDRDQAGAILMTPYANDDATAVLIYGVDATEVGWSYALLFQREALNAVLVVGTGGEIERIRPAAAAQGARIRSGARSAPKAQDVGICDWLGSICSDSDSPCFQCKAVCSLVVSLGLHYAHVGVFACAAAVASLCGPAFKLCILPAFAICQSLATAIGGAGCIGVCKELDYCKACKPTACRSGQYYDHDVCECRCSRVYPDTRFCAGRCVDASSNRAHCGACGNACKQGEPCVDGQCQARQLIARDDHFVVAPGRTCAETPHEPDNAWRTTCAAAFLDVLANDEDPSGEGLFVDFDLDAPGPAHGDLSIMGYRDCHGEFPGGLIYAPEPGFTGVDTFGYVVYGYDNNDNQVSASATVTVTVSPDAPNRPPASAPDSAMTAKNTPVRISVLANDSDPDGDELQLIHDFYGLHPDGLLRGELACNGDGTLTYTPNRDFVGTDWFYYGVVDPHGGYDEAVVTVTVGEQGTRAIAARSPRRGHRRRATLGAESAVRRPDDRAARPGPRRRTPDQPAGGKNGVTRRRTNRR